MQIEIAVGVAILVVLVFLATVDAAFSRISDVGLRRLTAESEEGPKPATTQFLREILDNRPRFRLAISSTIQVLLIGFTIDVILIILQFNLDISWLALWALLICIAATVLFRQVIPRMLMRNDTEQKLLYLLPVVRPIYRMTDSVIEPFAASQRSKDLQRLERTIAPDADEKTDDTSEDFQALMEVGEAEGIIEEDERELIESMVEFSETRAGEIMTPRTEICALPAETTIRKARDLMIEERYSRLPVYRDSVDNIEGVIYVRDLLIAWAEGREGEPITNILREPFFVPETKSAADLLKAMQQNHVQFAIVIDEYGGVAGIVTVEDILEEIVGEIEDEDTEDEEIIEIIEGEGGYWDVLGSTEIDKIERLFDLDLEEEDVTTVAGLITREAGYVPKAGEKLRLGDIEAEILHADDKKVMLVRLKKAGTTNQEAISDASANA
jgi:putative hemolysin